MTSMTSESQHRHMPEPVSRFSFMISLAHAKDVRASVDWYWKHDTTFAHVLNVPVSEEIWPGEAIDLFPQQFFAKSPHTGMFVHQGSVFEYMRCEILRLYSGKFSTKDFMEDELAFYYESGGSFPFGFGDSSDDEDELLLDCPLTWDE